MIGSGDTAIHHFNGKASILMFNGSLLSFAIEKERVNRTKFPANAKIRQSLAVQWQGIQRYARDLTYVLDRGM